MKSFIKTMILVATVSDGISIASAIEEPSMSATVSSTFSRRFRRVAAGLAASLFDNGPANG